ncbi:hypothetical protein [Nibrella saemangeumensis]
MNTLQHHIASIQQQIAYLTETLSFIRQQVESKGLKEYNTEEPESEIGINRYRKLHGRGWHYSQGYTS